MAERIGKIDPSNGHPVVSLLPRAGRKVIQERIAEKYQGGGTMAQTTAGSSPAALDRASGLLRKGAAALAPFAEIELTLTGSAERLEQLFLKKIAPRTKVTERHLVSTYYDSTALDLRRRGYALRVRDDGKSFTQTLKATGVAGSALARRHEWSVALEGPKPFLEKLAAPELDAVFAGLTNQDLTPLFVSDVQRRTKVYRVADPLGGRAELEVSLDMGKLLTEGKRGEICELELELVSGSPQAIYQEAARLNEVTALQLQPWSKSKRGFMQATGGAPAWCRTPPLRFSELMTVEEVMSRVFSNCSRQWLENHAAYGELKDPRALAQIDEALHRLCTAADLFSGVLAPEVAKFMQSELAYILGERESARDWDMICSRLLQAPSKVFGAHDAFGRLATAAKVACEDAHHEADDVLQSKRYCAFMLFLEGWVDQQGWRQPALTGASALERLTTPIMDHVDAAAGKHHRTVERLSSALKKPSGEALRELRDSLKKSGELMEMFSSLYGKRRQKPYRKALRALLKDLDVCADVAVARKRLWALSDTVGNQDEKVALRFAAGLALGWLLHGVERMRNNLAKDGQSLASAQVFWK
jgi:inorganic triphosphatase YgiF